MKIEANYVSLVFTLIVAMLLTTYFTYLINNSVENIARLVRERSDKPIDCVYIVRYNYTKIILLNKTCIGEILHIDVSNNTIYHSDEYIWIEADLDQSIKIISREEIIVV